MLKFFTKIMLFFLCAATALNIPAARKYKSPEPQGLSEYVKPVCGRADNADFYVATDGDDNNDGSFEHPFATVQRARDAVRQLDKTARSGEIVVAIKKGEYRVNSLEFGREDSGTESCPVKYCAYGDGEVVINGGISVSPSSFSKVTDKAVLERLSRKARKNVVCYDLSQAGITADDYGVINAIGSYNTAYKYTDGKTGSLYCELFVNDERMTLARYPDEGFLETEKVVSTGEGLESNGSTTVNPDWDTLVDPAPDVYKVSRSLAKRINSWKTLDDVWMFGFWKYDWADASSPVGAFSYKDRTVSPEYVSLYGTKTGAPYYFFNVLEELDSPGEWYLDRENGIIYMYPRGDLGSSVIDLSLTTYYVIYAHGTDFLTFENLTVKGTRGDGIRVDGNCCTVKGCLVKNVAGSGISVNGSGNTVTECEITRTGKGGIYVSGGDRNTLTPSGNSVDNNLIHDWSEIYQTYQPAVTLDGVGNICSHNEMYNSPHEAVTYSGNNNVIEYNVIHDVCLLSDDAGAIYSGRHWDWYGNVIRYNCIYNLGSGDHTPDGIYMDDALSGQTIYGNLLVNVPKYALHLGGGRDLTVKNNVIINAGDRAVSYDQRAYDGVQGGWFTHASSKDEPMWKNLYASPWQSEIWKNTFPQMTKFSDDFEKQDEPGFVPNPAYSEVSGNVIAGLKKSIGEISERADRFSDISGNALYKLTEEFNIFTDPSHGDYTLKEGSKVYAEIPGFENLPVNEMGRY